MSSGHRSIINAMGRLQPRGIHILEAKMHKNFIKSRHICGGCLAFDMFNTFNSKIQFARDLVF